MHEPAEQKSNHQREEYPQGARHRSPPEKKTDLDYSDVLSNKHHRQAGEEEYQRQFQIHLSAPFEDWIGATPAGVQSNIQGADPI